MKKIFKNRWLVCLFVITAFVGIARVATVENGTNVNKLVLDENKVYDSEGTLRWITGIRNAIQGAIAFGDAITSPTLPTYSTGDQFGVKVPFYNATGASTAKGQVLTSSSSVSALVNIGSPFYANSVALVATTTVIGIADGVYASATTGWMTVSGYALVLTTGTVMPGDVLITTAPSGSPKGYGSVTFSTATWANPKSAFAVSVGSGNVAGGLTPVVLR